MIRLIDTTLKALIALGIAGVMLCIGLQIVARATIGAYSWPEELSVILMIWSLMLAAGYVLNDRGHVGISFLTESFGARAGATVSALMHLIIILFSLAVIWGSIPKIQSVWGMTTGALGISRGIPNLAVPVSFGFYAIISLRLIGEDLKAGRECK